LTQDSLDNAPGGGGNPSLHVDDDGIAWVTFDDPQRKVNVLDPVVMTALSDVLGEVARLAAAGLARVAVFRSAKPENFIAGADVAAIQAIQTAEEGAKAARLGQAIYFELETLPLPTVAAIHGLCLGGGTELALA
jgi:3-hydroxyacyl-CoA dehydrogenase/enoyl-CoA hydratase/3-hydroxybutyryl-CoA epimerase